MSNHVTRASGAAPILDGYAQLDEAMEVVVADPYDYRKEHPDVGWAEPPEPAELAKYQIVEVWRSDPGVDPRDHDIVPRYPAEWEPATSQWERKFDTAPSPARLEAYRQQAKETIYLMQREKNTLYAERGRFDPATEVVKRFELEERARTGVNAISNYPCLEGESIGRGLGAAATYSAVENRIANSDAKRALYDEKKFVSEAAIDAAVSAVEVDEIVVTYEALV